MKLIDGIYGRSKLSEIMEELILTATGKVKADLVIRNGELVNVYTGEIISKCDIAVKRDRIVLIGKADHTIGNNTRVLEASGKYLIPGLLDGHIHIESSMITLTEFSKVVIPRGTSAIFIDPHEIANVLGLKGIQLIIEESKKLPLKVFICIPSCVPASSNEFETSGAKIDLEDIIELLSLENVIGLAEVMNYPSVISAEEDILNKIKATIKAGKIVEGHAPKVLGSNLCAYVSAGISSCHESTSLHEAAEKMRLGMTLMIREGSAWKDLANVIKVITKMKLNSRKVCLVSDDRHPEDLVKEGHVDHLIRRAIEEGVDPIVAIQMATLNTAEHYNLDLHMGGLAPPRYADIIIVDNLEKFKVEKVILDGKLIANNGELLVKIPKTSYPKFAMKTVNVKRKTTINDFKVKAKDNNVRVNVIEVFEDSILTRKRIEKLSVENNEVKVDLNKDVIKVGVIERHKATGNISVGFVKGFNIKEGAAAQTIAHDSHNIVVVGASEEDMVIAVNKLIEINGGITVVKNGKIIALLELPIAGLMSDKEIETVCQKINNIKKAWRDLGCEMKSPFMTMSMLALPVIPEIRITDKGLIDVNNFKKINLILDQ